MKFLKYITLIIIPMALMFTLASCKIGSDSYQEPWEINSDFVYCVVYDGMGGTINTLEIRTVWYAGDSLIREPQGSKGMLIEPINGEQVVVGWYTSYKNIGTEEAPVYEYNEDDRWDFDSDQINSGTTDENKTITLYARWIDPPSVYFVDADNTDEVFIKWENVNVTEPILRPTTTEKLTIEKNNVTYTLFDYYYDKELTKKVAFGKDSKDVEKLISDQNGEETVYIYCKYIEGKYTRINNLTDLNKITDFNGKYILASDIDMENQSWTSFRNDKDDPFTGTFIGNGYSISNININATNKVSKLAAKTAKEKSYGFFGSLSNATFSGVNFKNVTITVGSSSNIELCTGVYGGRAEKTTFENCSIEDFTVVSDGEVNVKVTLGNAAFLDEACKITNCEFDNPNTEGLKINSENLIIGDESPIIE